LLIKWWSEYHIIGDFGNGWRLKLQYMRKRIRGWDINTKADKKKKEKKNNILRILKN
jgi:hypothetical protein